MIKLPHFPPKKPFLTPMVIHFYVRCVAAESRGTGVMPTASAGTSQAGCFRRYKPDLAEAEYDAY